MNITLPEIFSRYIVKQVVEAIIKHPEMYLMKADAESYPHLPDDLTVDEVLDLLYPDKEADNEQS